MAPNKNFILGEADWLKLAKVGNRVSERVDIGNYVAHSQGDCYGGGW